MFRARCLFPIVAFCLATLTMQAQDEMTATYIHHALEITVPYQGVHQGAGRLEVTLLSPEDKVLARSESVVKASAASGIWEAELTPDYSIPFDDLVWERVRSRVFFEGEQTPAMTQVRSVSTILRRPVVHLLGQTHYLAGAPAALRVIVTDGTPNATPVTNGTVRIDILKQDAAPSGSLHRQARSPRQLKRRIPLPCQSRRRHIATASPPTHRSEAPRPPKPSTLRTRSRYCSRRKSRSISHRRRSTFAHSRSTAPITTPRPRARSPLSLKTHAATVSIARQPRPTTLASRPPSSFSRTRSISAHGISTHHCPSGDERAEQHR